MKKPCSRMAGVIVFLAVVAASVLLSAAPAGAGSILISPRGGEKWEVGSAHPIVWNTNGSYSGDTYVDLYFSSNSGATWEQIAQNIPVRAGEYAWTVPHTPTDHARIRITVSSLVESENGAMTPVVVATEQSGDFAISQTETAPSPAPVQPGVVSGRGEMRLVIGGREVARDLPVVFDMGKVLVPMRPVFEALGMAVTWDPGERSATATKESTTVKVIVASETAYLNGRAVALDPAPRIIEGRVFVPLELIGEASGASVSWDNNSNTLSIAIAGGSSGTARHIVIKDSRGREVIVPVRPKRIVVCDSYVADAICALGMGDAVVGAPADLTSISLLSQKITNAQSVGTMKNPNADLIISLKPEIMFGPVNQPQELTARLQGKGIPVVLLDCERIDVLENSLEVLGKILGEEDRAAQLIGFIEKYRQLVVERLKDVPKQQRPRVYWEAAADYTVGGPDSEDGLLLSLLGVTNIAGDKNAPLSRVTPEWVVSRNPDFIIKAADYVAVPSGYLATSDAMHQLHDLIIERPGWKHISAVANDRVYILSRAVVAGPQYVIGLLYAAKWLYPALFQDVDPVAVQTEMLQQFYGLEFNGAWAYPLPWVSSE
ncbi:MAG: stalk domain-containing protein [Thermacetogeniaceae bacterium]